MNVPRLLLLAALALAPAQARPAPDMTLTLTVDGREVGPVPAHLSGSHLMLPLTAFASAGFRPLLDTENGLVDLAGCLRVSLGSPRRWQTGGPAVVGVASAARLPDLPLVAERRAGRWYLPAKSTLQPLQYTVTFDKASGRVDLKSPTDPQRINPVTEACLLNLSGRSVTTAQTP